MIGASSVLSLILALPRWPLVRLLLVPARALAAATSIMGNLLCLHDGNNELANAAGAAHLDASLGSSRSLERGSGGGVGAGPSTPPRPTLLWSPRGSREHPRASSLRLLSSSDEEGPPLPAAAVVLAEEALDPDAPPAASAVPSLLALSATAVARHFERLDPLHLSLLPGDLFQQVFDTLSASGDLSLSALRRLPAAPDLHAACLEGACRPAEPPGDAFLAFLATCPRLCSLDLTRCTLVTDKGIAALCAALDTSESPQALRTGSLPPPPRAGLAPASSPPAPAFRTGSLPHRLEPRSPGIHPNCFIEGGDGGTGAGASSEAAGRVAGSVTSGSTVAGSSNHGAVSRSPALDPARGQAVSPFAAASQGLFAYGSRNSCHSGNSRNSGGNSSNSGGNSSNSGTRGSNSGGNSSPERSLASCNSSNPGTGVACVGNSHGNSQSNSPGNRSNSFVSAASSGPVAGQQLVGPAVGGWAAAVGASSGSPPRLGQAGGHATRSNSNLNSDGGGSTRCGEQEGGATCSRCGGEAIPLAIHSGGKEEAGCGQGSSSRGGGDGYGPGGYGLGGYGLGPDGQVQGGYCSGGPRCRGGVYCCRACSGGMRSASSCCSDAGAGLRAAAGGGYGGYMGGYTGGYGGYGCCAGGAGALSVLKLNFCIQLTDASLQHIADLPSLTVLELRCCEHLTSSGLHHLSSLSNLSRLSLRQCARLRGSLSPLAQAMPKLASLDLGWCTQLGDAQTSPLGALGESLTHLDLSATRVTDRGVEALSKLHALRRLSLKACEVGAAGVGTIGSHFSHLTRLELERCLGVNDDACEGLAKLRKLRRLGLSCTAVTDGGLARLSTLTDLRRLDLDSCRVTDEGVRVVYHYPFLKHLNLSDTQTHDSTLELLASIARSTTAVAAAAATRQAEVEAAKCGRGVGAGGGAVGWKLPPPPPRAHLEWLSLSFTQVTNAGVANLKSLVGLTHLNIDSDALGDAAVLQLKGLTALTALEAFSARIHEPGAAAIGALLNLKRLELCGGGLTDSAASHFSKLTQLTYLSLAHNPRLGDACLSTLVPALPGLEQLNLSSTGVTAGAVTGLLPGARALRAVSLVNTRVPEGAVAGLKAALPVGCVVKHSCCKERR